MKKKYEIAETVIQHHKQHLMHDYIDGEVTPKNENPVIFEYNYTRGGSLDIEEELPSQFLTDFVGDVIKIGLTGAGIATGIGAIAVSGTWVLATDISTMFATWAEIFVHFGVKELMVNLITYLGSVSGIIGTVAIGFISTTFQSVQKELINRYREWWREAIRAKNKVDTEGYYDEEGEWHWKYDGFKISMEFRYLFETITTTQKEHMYDTKGRYIEIYAANPPEHYGTILKPFTLTKPITVEYIGGE